MVIDITEKYRMMMMKKMMIMKMMMMMMMKKKKMKQIINRPILKLQPPDFAW